jgi:thiol:disulfide interchange protein DsbD
LLFTAFALSLFGMFEIVLPSSLAAWTSSQEGRGGLVGTIFMALTFTIISFTCVAPFYGTFIALTASAGTATDWFKIALGALAYSTTFAAPFFFLALFPTLLRSLPRSGSWMNTVKVVMGFLELAAAFKLLRAAELNFFGQGEYLSFDLVLGIYVALCVLCGLYLLRLYKLPHDHGGPEHLSVSRLMFSLAFIGLGIYLLPGLFKGADGKPQRPRGVIFSWVESFLLPESNDTPAPAPVPGKSDSPPTRGGDTLAANGSKERVREVRWGLDLKAALAEARKEKTPVFIDFTGFT